MKKIKAFSLMELLVTLVLFGLVLVVISGVLTTQARILNSMPAAIGTIADRQYLIKVLQMIAENSFESGTRNGHISFTALNGNRYEIFQQDAIWKIQEFKGSVLLNERILDLPKDQIMISAVQNGRIKGIKLNLNGHQEYFFIMSYKNIEG